MAEYIEREALLGAIDCVFFKTDHDGAEQIGVLSCRRAIRDFPSADVVPVVHGRWVDNCCYNTCSACGNSVHAWNDDGDLQEFSYCPNCGARMDGEA